MDWPDVTYDRVGNILLSRLMGADVRLVKAGFGIGFKESWEQALAEVEARAASRTRSRPARRTIRSAGRASPAGPSRSSEQERELGVFFDTIIVCSVTGSTQAGMIAGFAGSGRRPRRVIGIDASATPDETRDQVARIARRTAAADRPRPRPARRRDHPRRPLPRRRLRHPRRSDARGDAPRRAGSRG